MDLLKEIIINGNIIKLHRQNGEYFIRLNGTILISHEKEVDARDFFSTFITCMLKVDLK